MTTRGISLLVSAGVALVMATTAEAVLPTLSSVSQQNRHPAATFSAPRSNFATIYLSSKPDRATDGSFLQENVEEIDILTDFEIQSGRWSDENQVDPGTYWVMLRATPDFGSCFREDGSIDPAGADGFSNVMTVTIPEPRVRYAARITTYRYLREASLRLIASPLGEKRPYRVCYRVATGRSRCLSGTLAGYDWNSSAEDTLTISTRTLSRIATFSWYVAGKRVVTKRVRMR